MLIYAIGAGITAAAATRLALQLFVVEDFTFNSFQLPINGIVISCHYLPVLGLGNCTPAAFHRSGSRFSGSLSGIEPQFPVTRYSHGSPLHYHRS